jgi:hypothetical protein
MSYILRRTDQGGGYVAKPGISRSYTRRLDQAQKFATRDEADANRCKENEVIEDLERVLDYARG